MSKEGAPQKETGVKVKLERQLASENERIEDIQEILKGLRKKDTKKLSAGEKRDLAEDITKLEREFVMRQAKVKEIEAKLAEKPEVVDVLPQINVGSVISYKDVEYRVAELPTEENKNKYVFTHPGKPNYKLTVKQLSSILEKGEATLKSDQEKKEEGAEISTQDISSAQKAADSEKSFEVVGGAEILTGEGAKSLVESARNFQLKSGDTVIAGTYEGINYKDRNEDRVAVSPEGNLVAVVDGMGGYGKGDKAAEILAQELLNSPEDAEKAVENAKRKMEEEGLGKSGAVFISATLSNWQDASKTPYISVAQMGDARLIVIDKTGGLFFASTDHSHVQQLVDAGAISRDRALHHPQRNKVTRAVSAESKDEVVEYKVNLAEGDLVILMSDGISDNFTPGEIAEKVKTARTRGESVAQIFATISKDTDERMANMEKIKDSSHRTEGETYSDGYRSQPKSDNQALAIIEIKGGGESTENAEQAGSKIDTDKMEKIAERVAKKGAEFHSIDNQNFEQLIKLSNVLNILLREPENDQITITIIKNRLEQTEELIEEKGVLANRRVPKHLYDQLLKEVSALGIGEYREYYAYSLDQLQKAKEIWQKYEKMMPGNVEIGQQLVNIDHYIRLKEKETSPPPIPDITQIQSPTIEPADIPIVSIPNVVPDVQTPTKRGRKKKEGMLEINLMPGAKKGKKETRRKSKVETETPEVTWTEENEKNLEEVLSRIQELEAELSQAPTPPATTPSPATPIENSTTSIEPQNRTFRERIDDLSLQIQDWDKEKDAKSLEIDAVLKERNSLPWFSFKRWGMDKRIDILEKEWKDLREKQEVLVSEIGRLRGEQQEGERKAYEKVIRELKIALLKIKKEILDGADFLEKIREANDLCAATLDKQPSHSPYFSPYDEKISILGHFDKDIENIKKGADPLWKFIRETMGEDPEETNLSYKTMDPKSVENRPDGSFTARSIDFSNYHDFLIFRKSLTEEEKIKLDTFWGTGEKEWKSPSIFANKQFWEGLKNPQDPMSKFTQEFWELEGKALRGELPDEAGEAIRGLHAKIDEDIARLEQETN